MTDHQISEDEQQKAYEDKMNADFYAEQNLLHQQKMQQEQLASEYREFLAWKAQQSQFTS